jgi:hypothetical protein
VRLFFLLFSHRIVRVRHIASFSSYRRHLKILHSKIISEGKERLKASHFHPEIRKLKRKYNRSSTCSVWQCFKFTLFFDQKTEFPFPFNGRTVNPNQLNQSTNPWFFLRRVTTKKVLFRIRL